MCELCKPIHLRAKSSRNPHVLLLDESFSPSSFLCAEHRHRFQLFDRACSRLICSQCVEVHHAHSLASLPDTARECGVQMEPLLHSAQTCTKLLKQQLRQHLAINNKLSLQFSQQKLAVKAFFDQMRSALEARECSLLQDLAKSYSEMFSDLRLRIQKVEEGDITLSTVVPGSHGRGREVGPEGFPPRGLCTHDSSEARYCVSGECLLACSRVCSGQVHVEP